MPSKQLFHSAYRSLASCCTVIVAASTRLSTCSSTCRNAASNGASVALAIVGITRQLRASFVIAKLNYAACNMSHSILPGYASQIISKTSIIASVSIPPSTTARQFSAKMIGNKPSDVCQRFWGHRIPDSSYPSTITYSKADSGPCNRYPVAVIPAPNERKISIDTMNQRDLHTLLFRFH